MTLKTLSGAAVAAAFLLVAPAFGADMPMNPAGAQPISGTAVFQAFHEKAGIDRMIDDFVTRISTDPRIAQRFQGSDLGHLRETLKMQVCYLVGGPCTYDGKDMKSAHASMGLQNQDFNDLAEDLQKSMDKEGVSFQAQSQLLAKLAPMQKVIVTK